MVTRKGQKVTHTHTHIYIYIYCLLLSNTIKLKYWQHLARKRIHIKDDDRDNTEIITSHILLEKYIFLSDYSKVHVSVKCDGFI